MVDHKWTLSSDDILNELRSLWAEQVGSKRELASDTRIVQWLKDEGVWEDVDVGELRFDISDYFGIEIAEEEWDAFWGAGLTADEWKEQIEANLTFGRLADLILAHLPDISFEPVEICGRNCGPAGAFLGIRSLAEHVVSNVQRFAPSTAVRTRLKKDGLVRFWSQLRILTRNAVPPLSDPLAMLVVWLGLATIGLAATALVTVSLQELIAIPDSILLRIVEGFSVTGLLTLILGSLRIAAGSRLLRLPSGIRTFRDLAERISAALTQ